MIGWGRAWHDRGSGLGLGLGLRLGWGRAWHDRELVGEDLLVRVEILVLVMITGEKLLNMLKTQE